MEPNGPDDALNRKRKRDDDGDDQPRREESRSAAEPASDLLVPASKRSKVENSAVVMSHYDARPNSDVYSREKSPIIQVRHFNNWVKSVLIGEYVKPGDTVFDICGGKGGDLPKWHHGGIHHLVLAGSLGFLFRSFSSFRSFRLISVLFLDECLRFGLFPFVSPLFCFLQTLRRNQSNMQWKDTMSRLMLEKCILH